MTKNKVKFRKPWFCHKCGKSYAIGKLSKKYTPHGAVGEVNYYCKFCGTFVGNELLGVSP